MAWIVDTGFGNAFTTSLAVAPFDTSGGNKMLGANGAGLVYRDDINITDTEISCQVLFKGRFTFASPSGMLMARRQPDGSFYIASWGMGASASNFPENMGLFIYHYNGVSDTFTFLAESIIYFGDPKLVDLNDDIINIHFRLKGTSLSVRAMDEADSIKIVEVGVIDDKIVSSGNLGIAANIIPGPFFGVLQYLDNLKFYAI